MQPSERTWIQLNILRSLSKIHKMNLTSVRMFHRRNYSVDLYGI
jgi:hypothetical protein